MNSRDEIDDKLDNNSNSEKVSEPGDQDQNDKPSMYDSSDDENSLYASKGPKDILTESVKEGIDSSQRYLPTPNS
jgi:hypothetical protein